MSDRPPTPAERYQAWHRQWLAPHAVAEADSGGRKNPEAEHPYRTCFQRDRDRIVHCSAFRRLDFKTQVFVPHVQDHFRTRLTHTLEVAQIGRSLGRALRLNEDLIEAVALAHDLGHPPFGHGGEVALTALLAAHGGFEHNRQSLRVVDYLEHPYPDFRGLNLTAAVRRCIAKHTSRYDLPADSEFSDGLPAPWEGRVVDLADEIAYTSADLEDALAAGWITEAHLADVELWRSAWAAAQADFPRARPIHQRIRAVKAVLAAMADDVIAATHEDTCPPHAPEHPDQPPAASKGTNETGPRFSPSMARAVADMGRFLMDNVYLHPANLQQTRASQQIIRDLFGAYTARPGLLPQRYRDRIATDGLHRVACDYIAGMTDRYCRQQHEKIGS